MSIKEVAEAAGLTSNLISQFERGMTGISLNSLTRLASAMNLPVASLFSPVNLQVIRARERAQIIRPGANVPLSLASPGTFPIRVLECRLAPNSVTLDSQQPHLYMNTGEEEAVLIMVIDARG